MWKVDLLAIGAHPDDVELCAGGTLLRMIDLGHSAGLLDLTMGELGTNGSGSLRLEEAEKARQLIGAEWRHNLQLRDGFFEIDEAALLSVVRVIRTARPDIILANAPSDRHPDHGRAARLVDHACFLSGLPKIILEDEAGNLLEKWRPKIVLNFIQDRYIKPDIVVDITACHQRKMEVIAAYGSQFFMNRDKLPTPISGEDFWAFLEARAREMGRAGGVVMGEGFVSKTAPVAYDLFDLIRF